LRSDLVSRLVRVGLFMAVALPWARAWSQETYNLTPRGEWRQEATADPDSAAGQLQAARRALAEGRATEARRLADRWLKEHRGHPLEVEGFLVRGDALAASGNYYKALFDYEYIARHFPGSEHFFTVLEREYRIAVLYSEGLKRRFLGMPILPASGEAEELFIRIQERAPGSELGERASIALGDHYYRHRHWANASDAYDLFLTNYPDSRFREHAMLRLIQANLAQYRGSQYDPTGLLQATQFLRRYQQEYPAAAERLGAEELLEEIRDAAAEKLLHSAAWYDRRRESVSAAFLYRRLAEQFPGTPAADEALQRLEAMGQIALTSPAASFDDAAMPHDDAAREAQP
jgi:outer membrane assembly lipoprotein YfiO